jgi:hypothetical protein
VKTTPEAQEKIAKALAGESDAEPLAQSPKAPAQTPEAGASGDPKASQATGKPAPTTK